MIARNALIRPRCSKGRQIQNSVAKILLLLQRGKRDHLRWMGASRLR